MGEPNPQSQSLCQPMGDVTMVNAHLYGPFQCSSAPNSCTAHKKNEASPIKAKFSSKLRKEGEAAHTAVKALEPSKCAYHKSQYTWNTPFTCWNKARVKYTSPARQGHQKPKGLRLHLQHFAQVTHFLKQAQYRPKIFNTGTANNFITV